MKGWAAAIIIVISAGLISYYLTRPAAEEPIEPEIPKQVSEEVSAPHIGVMLHQQEFTVDGQTSKIWTVKAEQVRNVEIHDSTKNEDDTYTVSLSFEAVDDDSGAGIAAEVKMKYETKKVDLPDFNSEVLTYPVLDVEPISVKQVGEWETKEELPES